MPAASFIRGSLEDQAAAQPLHAAGTPLRQIAAALGWSYGRASEAVRAIRGLPSDNELRQARRGKTAPEVVPEAPKAEPAAEGKRKPIRISKVATRSVDVPRGVVSRLILTAAQDDTPVHEGFWRNLTAYAAHLDAQLAVGGFTYQLGLFEDHAVATGVYAAELQPYLEFGRVQLGPDLLIVGDANILPTTANPLAGWHTVNGGGHVVIPHARRALETIPRMPGRPPRYVQSTGCCTLPSYTPRASGRRALFHHTYGALLIEIDVDGEVFIRELAAEDDGSFQDLTARVDSGVVTYGHAVAALVCGDDHQAAMDPNIALATWGIDVRTNRQVTSDCLIDLLRPAHQVRHDVLDFRRRNHHDRGSVHSRARMLAAGTTNVEEEVHAAAAFLVATSRPWCQTHQVESNHDDALTRWLRDLKAAEDEENAYYHAELNAAWLRAIRRRDDTFNPIRHAMGAVGGYDNVVDFVGYGRGLRIAGVECGLHGDIGISGSRGSPNQFRRLGDKVVSAHTHSPKIVEGVYVAGVSASLSQGYNDRGPGAWANGHVVIYPSGKRALLCMHPDGRAWAEARGQEGVSLAA
ncbi:hypothetical protein [Aureimonas sp. SK2]|uniref:hypothetical protein n=1 Tax=Aureimonas sp. SK2 TaxID=3015992 RepID=UPI002444621D|nr:hypothetical protein [Aureimonas sp. SK2]